MNGLETEAVDSLSDGDGGREGRTGLPVFCIAPHRSGQAKIVADINLDMFLPLYDLKVLEVQGLAESTLGDVIRRRGEEPGRGGADRP